MPLNCGEKLISDRLKAKFGGQRRIIPGRTANLTQPLPGRARSGPRVLGPGADGRVPAPPAAALRWALGHGRLLASVGR